MTPSYNQGEFIEETIRSVLLQGYPDLEYIIIDGGSTDRTVEVIKKYEPWLADWVSEEDRGQAHAINKGFGRTTGIVLSWLNSDDVLLPGALMALAAALSNPDDKVLAAGKAEYRDVSGAHSIWSVDSIPRTFTEAFSFFDTYFAQPSVFFTRQALDSAGSVREDLHYAMDLDLWLRMCQHASITLVDQHLSWMRQHKDAKTSRDYFNVLDEVERVLKPYARDVAPEIARRTHADGRRRRSQAWIAGGFRSIAAGDRKNALLAAYRAAQARVDTVTSRGWIGLVVRVVLPSPIRRLAFRLPAGD